MYLHREGFKTILIALAVYLGLEVGNIVWLRTLTPPYVSIALFFILSVLLFVVIWFFRIPKRNFSLREDSIIAPADGKIVVIEDVYDEEYFKGKVLQISIFMNPLNVHVNRYPIGGRVVYSKYHSGKYLIASHPKSSVLNERHSVVIETKKTKILVKQIAGALARRIVNYAKIDAKVNQNQELGFIKFGSRVDILLPVGTFVNVAMNEKVKGGVTVLARLLPVA